jgi:hypothetical protein
MALPPDLRRPGRRRAPEPPAELATEPLPIVPPPPPPPPPVGTGSRHGASNGSRMHNGGVGRHHSVWDYNASPEYRPVEEYYVTPEQLGVPRRAEETGPNPVYEESPSGRHRRP